MAFLTNQWMKYLPDRIRSHTPISTDLKRDDITDEWCRSNKIKAAFRFVRENGDYQTVFLSTDDVALLLLELVQSADKRARTRVALASLNALDSTTLFSVVAKVFASRARHTPGTLEDSVA